MKTNEVEKLLGISKQTLYFYEREGLVIPKRDTNDYRIYEDEHLQTLKLIKLLREMDIPIDDIKGILNNELSFQECLEKRKIHLEESFKQLEQIKETVEVLKEKEVPLLKNLESIDTTKYPFTLGFQKTTKKVSLGRRTTKKRLIKGLVYSITMWVALSLVAASTPNNLFRNQLPKGVFLVLPTLLVLAFLFSYIGKGRFVEFDEKGISYYPYKSIKQKWSYLKAILTSNDASYIKHINYEDIKCIFVKTRKQYMRTRGLAVDWYTIDYKFEFYNGDPIWLIGSITLENDNQWVASILLEKVKTIIDKDHVLEALSKGMNLTDYMRTQVK